MTPSHGSTEMMRHICLSRLPCRAGLAARCFPPIAYRDGSSTRHVVHKRQLPEAALVVVAADLLRLGAVVHFHVDAVLAAANQSESRVRLQAGGQEHPTAEVYTRPVHCMCIPHTRHSASIQHTSQSVYELLSHFSIRLLT